jgi:hypothetical protein
MNIYSTRTWSTKWFGAMYDLSITPFFPFSAQLFIRIGKTGFHLMTHKAPTCRRYYVVRLERERRRGNDSKDSGSGQAFSGRKFA